MATVRNTANVTRNVAKLADYKPPATRKRRKPEPVAHVRAPELAMTVARELAGGDMARVEVQVDGTVRVNNRPRNGSPKL